MSSYRKFVRGGYIPCPDLEHVAFEVEHHHGESENREEAGVEHQEKHGNTCKGRRQRQNPAVVRYERTADTRIALV